MDVGGLQQQLMVELDDLDQYKAEVMELKANLVAIKKFIQSLKDKINESREKRKELCGQLKQKERPKRCSSKSNPKRNNRRM